MTSSKILFFLCLAFILGIFVESLAKIPQIFLWIFLCLAVLMIFVKFSRIAGFCLLILILGILRTQISEFNIASDKLSKFNGQGEITLTGFVNAEPDVRDTSQNLKVKSNGSTILITTQRYPEYHYLDQLKIIGKLEAPKNTDTFNYQNYGIYSVMAFPKLELIERPHMPGLCLHKPGMCIYAGILNFKQKLRQSIEKNFLPPQSSIMEGTILGDNGAMSQDLKSKLNITGLRHIIAVSGTHVAILAVILMNILLAMGLWRQQSFYFSVFFVWLYIILIGLIPSAVRAGVMATVFLFAQKIGRQSNGERVITMAAAVMLAINPLLLIYDVGFQLSFLAVLGLTYLDGPIKYFLRFLKNEVLITVLSATMAAQIFTLPIMVFNFGNISFIAPLTNLLISPIVELLMIFGFLTSFAGVFSSFLGWVSSVPCYFLLSYFLWVINFFSKPWAMKTVENVHWMWLFAAYFALAFFVRYLKKIRSPF